MLHFTDFGGRYKTFVQSHEDPNDKVHDKIVKLVNGNPVLQALLNCLMELSGRDTLAVRLDKLQDKERKTLIARGNNHIYFSRRS